MLSPLGPALWAHSKHGLWVNTQQKTDGVFGNYKATSVTTQLYPNRGSLVGGFMWPAAPVKVFCMSSDHCSMNWQQTIIYWISILKYKYSVIAAVPCIFHFCIQNILNPTIVPLHRNTLYNIQKIQITILISDPPPPRTDEGFLEVPCVHRGLIPPEIPPVFQDF